MREHTDEPDWLRLLTKSENKSRAIGSGKSLLLSSIDGWAATRLPKLLIVWTFEKSSSDAFPSRTRPGRLTKRRDLNAIVRAYELFLINDVHECIVPWEENPTHDELCRTLWTDERLADLGEKTKRLNQKYRDRPIVFQSSFKNGTHLRLQYAVADYTNLPKCPASVEDLIAPHLDKLIGLELRLWKDHSTYGGPCGWFDNAMAQWEHQNGIKSSGELHTRMPKGDSERVPGFTEGRQDYWSGFAIDFLMTKSTPGFDDQGGHAVGIDHSLSLLSISQSTLAASESAMTNDGECC